MELQRAVDKAGEAMELPHKVMWDETEGGSQPPKVSPSSRWQVGGDVWMVALVMMDRV